MPPRHKAVAASETRNSTDTRLYVNGPFTDFFSLPELLPQLLAEQYVIIPRNDRNSPNRYGKTGHDRLEKIWNRLSR